MNEKKVVLEVKNLKKYFKLGRSKNLKAVDDVSFEMLEGEVLGIVGESGSGKTTLGRTCLGVYEPTEGTVKLFDQDLSKLNAKSRKNISKRAQMIFQDPYSSLDPQMTVLEIISEGLDIHNIGGSRKDKLAIVSELLFKVGLNQSHINRYIHEFSGGQRQRIGIARAIAVEPDFLMCDEPISALDVSMRAQIINLLLDLKVERNLSMMFIAHDLSIVKHISDRVAVMYLGSIVELADANSLYTNPLHPYTKVLLSAIPLLDPKANKNRERIKLSGEIPSPVDKPIGCNFFNRCKYALAKCREATPQLNEVEEGHFVACFLCK